MTGKRTPPGNSHQRNDAKTTTRLEFMREYRVRANCVPELVAQLRSKGTDGSFAVLMFSPLDSFSSDDDTDDDIINLQYSMEGGVVGLDWVLLAPRNVADRERIAELIAHRGHTVVSRRMNGVDFLRVEDGEIVYLGMQIVTELYKIDSQAYIGLLVDQVDIDLFVPATQSRTPRPRAHACRATGPGPRRGDGPVQGQLDQRQLGARARG